MLVTWLRRAKCFDRLYTAPIGIGGHLGVAIAGAPGDCLRSRLGSLLRPTREEMGMYGIAPEILA